MVKWVQNIYSGIKNWKTPSWLKVILQQMYDLMLVVLKTSGQAYINYLQAEILYAANQNWTPREKFDYVFKQAKKGFVEFKITLRDNELNTLINYLYSILKKNRAV